MTFILASVQKLLMCQRGITGQKMMVGLLKSNLLSILLAGISTLIEMTKLNVILTGCVSTLSKQEKIQHLQPDFLCKWVVLRKLRCRKSWNPFGVYRDGEPIHQVELRQGVQTGIQQIALLAGLVPEIEEREAALFNGYKWREWQETFPLMEPEGRWERAKGVAWFRLQNLKKSHIEDALNDSIKRASKT
jgi:hypothetical protein